MIYKKLFWLIMALILVIPGSLFAEDSILNKEELINKNEPIEINSDRMDAYNEEKMVMFSGNAVVKQGDKVLKADELKIHYKDEPKAKIKKKSKATFETGNMMEKITAVGNVTSTQGERTVTGDEATYYHESGQVIITGNVVMREGNNMIKGCKATIYLNESRGKLEECEQGKNQRVHLKIYPQEMKKEEIN
jgi:lipopolysaccharide export system protein LptA